MEKLLHCGHTWRSYGTVDTREEVIALWTHVKKLLHCGHTWRSSCTVGTREEVIAPWTHVKKFRSPVFFHIFMDYLDIPGVNVDIPYMSPHLISEQPTAWCLCAATHSCPSGSLPPNMIPKRNDTFPHCILRPTDPLASRGHSRNSSFSPYCSVLSLLQERPF